MYDDISDAGEAIFFLFYLATSSPPDTLLFLWVSCRCRRMLWLVDCCLGLSLSFPLIFRITDDLDS